MFSQTADIERAEIDINNGDRPIIEMLRYVMTRERVRDKNVYKSIE